MDRESFVSSVHAAMTLPQSSPRFPQTVLAELKERTPWLTLCGIIDLRPSLADNCSWYEHRMLANALRRR